jgi:hypothetical protein
MPFTLATAVLSLAAALLPAQQPATASQTAKTPQQELPVSLGHIREALKKPESKLAAPLRQADFRIEIAEEQHFRDLVDLLDFSAQPILPAVWFGGSQTQPLVSFGVSSIGQSIAHSIAKAHRERAERLAQEEVQRALNQFCATHECAAR